MKTIKVELLTDKTQIVKTISLDGRLGFNKVVGTCINSIFQFNERLRKHGAGHIKANENVSVIISTEGAVLMDTYEINSEYGFVLKFGKSAKSKRKFAACLNDLITWAAEETKTLTLEELVSELELQMN